MSELTRAAADLAAAIEEENAALRALDVPRALAIVARKAEGARLLRVALASASAGGATQAREAAQGLAKLVEENRQLLERALAVQSRVIATLARAVPQPQVGYRPAGTAPNRPAAVALSARA